MKTPEEIKKGMNHCSCSEPCVECLYDGRNFPLCIIRMLKDAIAYIQQLEAERDLVVEMLRNNPHCCEFCRHMPVGGYVCTSNPKADGSCWEWRGVCAENSGKGAEQHDY